MSAEILVQDKEKLEKEQNFHCKVVAISDKLKGSVYNENGLDLAKLLALAKEKKSLETYDDAQAKGWDSIKTGEPALTHVKKALELKKHVIMTNKGPVALAIDQLLQLAKKNNVQVKFEGTVLSGTPAINLGLNNLAGANVTEISGDVEGYDALGKVVIMTSTIMKHPITKDQVEREGITNHQTRY